MKDMFIVQADGTFPKDFTGPFMGKLQFKDGIAYTDKLIWVKLATLKGCKDVTPPDVWQRLMNRPVNKILVIRNAAYGDGLIITPAFLALREKYPHAEIHLFGRTDSRIVYENCPYIDSIINIRETELGVLFDDYDLVLDMVHSIECKPEADYSNALDIACQMMGTNLPSDPVPFYRPTEAERQECIKMLAELGVRPDEDIIIMQAEATARVRSLPPTTTLKIANHFANKGYRVLMGGHDMPLQNTFLSECPKCGLPAAIHSPGMQPQKNYCPKCREHLAFSPRPNHPKITFLHAVFQKYKARIHFTAASLAKLVITIDSVWSHLAAAMRIPSVIIFSNYHPYTRTKYYDHCSIVTPDYKKDVPCGPCNSLVGFCHMYPDQYAPCTTTIKPEAIIQAAEERLKGTNDLYQEMRDSAPLKYDPQETRDCPCCGFPRNYLITAKAEHLYTQCFNCKTIYLTQYPDQQFWKTLPSKVRGKKFYRPSRNNPPQEIRKGINASLEQLKLPQIDAKEPLHDIIGAIPDIHVGRSSFASQDASFISSRQYEDTPINEKFVLLVEALHEEEKPEQLIEHVYKRMKKGATLVCITPLADRYTGINSWAGVNAVVAGLNTVIPSKEAMTKMMEKIGFRQCHIAHNEVNGMVIAVK